MIVVVMMVILRAILLEANPPIDLLLGLPVPLSRFETANGRQGEEPGQVRAMTGRARWLLRGFRKENVLELVATLVTSVLEDRHLRQSVEGQVTRS